MHARSRNGRKNSCSFTLRNFYCKPYGTRLRSSRWTMVAVAWSTDSCSFIPYKNYMYGRKTFWLPTFISRILRACRKRKNLGISCSRFTRFNRCTKRNGNCINRRKRLNVRNFRRHKCSAHSGFFCRNKRWCKKYHKRFFQKRRKQCLPCNSSVFKRTCARLWNIHFKF